MVKQKLRELTSGCTSSIGNALAAKRNGKTCTRLSCFPTRRHILAASACGFIALIVGVALLCFTAARWLPAESVCIFPIERRAKMQSIVYVQKQQKSRTGWGEIRINGRRGCIGTHLIACECNILQSVRKPRNAQRSA